MRHFQWEHDILSNKTILVTGGTGSFGQNFIKLILEKFKPKKLIVFSRDEQKQFTMSQVLSRNKYPCIRFFIGDVRDYDRLVMALDNVDIVVHAAAMKHVEAAEYNPFECIKTNVYGTENIVRASLHNNVKKVIALSTDKACNPINLYGASKLAAEKIIIAANNTRGSKDTKFGLVRYGNVMGSQGSVYPLFKKLLSESKKSLPITDVRMTRFWISKKQSAYFVISSLEKLSGGEIFVPKIPSMKIIDLARYLAPEIDFEILGTRPGEKLHEAMTTLDDAKNILDIGDRYIINPEISFYDNNSATVKEGKKVRNNFVYESNNNEEQISNEDLDKIINET